MPRRFTLFAPFTRVSSLFCFSFIFSTFVFVSCFIFLFVCLFVVLCLSFLLVLLVSFFFLVFRSQYLHSHNSSSFVLLLPHSSSSCRLISLPPSLFLLVLDLPQPAGSSAQTRGSGERPCRPRALRAARDQPPARARTQRRPAAGAGAHTRAGARRPRAAYCGMSVAGIRGTRPQSWPESRHGPTCLFCEQ